MPWCPKCRTEYREGFTVCADCGSELVAEQPPEKTEKEPEWEQLAAAYAAQVEAEAASSGESVPEKAAEAVKTSKKSKSGGIYRNSAEKANDNKSSAWILLSFGLLGIIFLVLDITGVISVISVSGSSAFMYYSVMGILFLVFVIGGFVSLKNAKFFAKKAESENSLKNTLLEWCRENLNARDIDAKVGGQSMPEEILYFRRVAYIKEKLNFQFMNVEQSFLDSLIDEEIYDSVFEGKAE